MRDALQNDGEWQKVSASASNVFRKSVELSNSGIFLYFSGVLTSLIAWRGKLWAHFGARVRSVISNPLFALIIENMRPNKP